MLVLEDRDRALARGAHIYAEIAGAASTADAYHITAPAPHGAGAVACMELALLDAGLTPDVVTHINAHGTSTPANDLPGVRSHRQGVRSARAGRHLDQGDHRSFAGGGRLARGGGAGLDHRAGASSPRPPG